MILIVFFKWWVLIYGCESVVAPQHVESSWTRDEPKSPALAGGFISMAPPGKCPPLYFIFSCYTKFFTFLDINPRWYMIFKHFPPFHRLSFHFVNWSFCCAEAFEFDIVHDGNSGSSDWGNVLRKIGLSRYVGDKKLSKYVISTDHIWSRESLGPKLYHEVSFTTGQILPAGEVLGSSPEEGDMGEGCAVGKRIWVGHQQCPTVHFGAVQIYLFLLLSSLHPSTTSPGFCLIIISG